MPHKFQQAQVEKILAARERLDRGDATKDDLLSVVREGNGQEISAAMDAYGQGTESWSRIS